MLTAKTKSLVISEQEKRLGLLNSLSSEAIQSAHNYIVKQLKKQGHQPISGMSNTEKIVDNEGSESPPLQSYIFSELIVSSITSNQSPHGLVNQEREDLVKLAVTKLANRERTNQRRNKRKIKLKSFELSPNAEARLKYLKNQDGVPYSIIIEELLLDEAGKIKELNRELSKQKKTIKELEAKLKTQQSNHKVKQKEVVRLRREIAMLSKESTITNAE